MKTIVVVYTSMGGLVNAMRELLTKTFPGYRVVDIADDSLIREVIEHDGVTAEVRGRMLQYFIAATMLKPEAIICACSSVGEVAEEADKILSVPVIRIDRAMIEAAVGAGARIGVLASLRTTMQPTVQYVERLSSGMGKQVSVCGLVAEGAYAANSSGHPEKHDRLILEAARQLAPKVDVLLLAQGSMARMEPVLREATGLPVFSSPNLCVEALQKKLSKEERVQ